MKKIFFQLLSIVFIIAISSTSCSDSLEDSQISNVFNDAIYTSQSEFSPAVLRINKDVFDTINSNRINNIKTGEFYSINEIKREKDSIQINLSYSGGCKQHDFEIIWDGIVYTDEPCHMNLFLIHNSNNDNCEALITETISINLKELIGDVVYKDSCAYHIFSTYNSGDIADVIIESIN